MSALAHPVETLPAVAKEIRKEVIRMLCAAGSGHPGGSLSAVEIVTCLFFRVMRHDPKRPHWEDRDRFVLSKGHGCPALYAALALAGYFPREELKTLRKIGARLQGHPDTRRMPELEASTGSLGQGLSIATGMALAGALDRKDYRVFCLLSDGEMQEGQTWEAALFAGFHRLERLIAFVDYNRFQLDGPVASILDIEPVRAKWESFGWHVQEVSGHDIPAILNAIEKTKAVSGKPHVIIAHTLKGKGVSFMEGNNAYHGVAPTPEEAEAALRELDGDPSLSQTLAALGKVKKGSG
jgi:transketolase